MIVDCCNCGWPCSWTIQVKINKGSNGIKTEDWCGICLDKEMREHTFEKALRVYDKSEEKDIQNLNP